MLISLRCSSIACETYPFLPVVPAASLDFAVKHPALAPKQDDDPDGDQKVREAEQSPGRQVPARLMRRANGHGGRYPLPGALKPYPRPPSLCRRGCVCVAGRHLA